MKTRERKFNTVSQSQVMLLNKLAEPKLDKKSDNVMVECLIH